jgi:succinate dehydrogenase / fumarate reductase, flavoprotein subunit
LPYYSVGVLISEAVRGEGAYLINSEGDRFMAEYAPSRMELAPRDITSRAIAREIYAGRGIHPDGRAGGPCVYLDLRHMGEEKIMSRIPFCWEEAHRLLSIDAVHQPIPVRPTVHYSMGGIPVNTDGQVRSGPDNLIDAFFAAGEAACVSVHGAIAPLSKLVELNPNQTEVRLVLGQVYATQKRYLEAIAVYDEATKADPQDFRLNQANSI